MASWLLLSCLLARQASGDATWVSPYSNASLDDPLQYEVLLALYSSTSGPSWFVNNLNTTTANTGPGQPVAWGSPGVSYCR